MENELYASVKCPCIEVYAKSQAVEFPSPASSQDIHIPVTTAAESLSCNKLLVQ